jgi:hypothetical protein
MKARPIPERFALPAKCLSGFGERITSHSENDEKNDEKPCRIAKGKRAIRDGG